MNVIDLLPRSWWLSILLFSITARNFLRTSTFIKYLSDIPMLLTLFTIFHISSFQKVSSFRDRFAANVIGRSVDLVSCTVVPWAQMLNGSILYYIFCLVGSNFIFKAFDWKELESLGLLDGTTVWDGTIKVQVTSALRTKFS